MRGRHDDEFDKREEGFEKQFAHDEELQFKAIARRNKLLGPWAAGRLGKSGADADAYAKEVVMADFEEAGDNDVVAQGAQGSRRQGITEQQIRAQMNELLAQAVAQIKRAASSLTLRPLRRAAASAAARSVSASAPLTSTTR